MKNTSIIRIIAILTALLLGANAFAQTESVQGEEEDMIERADGLATSELGMTAAISKVDVEKIRLYPDLNLSNALQGSAAGFIVRANNHGIGNNTSSLYVRGLHSSGTTAIVIIDGMERSLDDIAAEEIGSIEILKDAAAKVLYGPRATNGVVLITTKRGLKQERVIRTSVEYGVTPTTRVPQMLGVNDYVALYNEARQNDGLANYYTDTQVAGYAASAGENDFLYPSVDWYDKFVGNCGSFRKASFEYNGGTDNSRYAVIGTYTGGSGLEKIGKTTGLDRFNLRGNLNIRINDFITAQADVAARLETRYWGGVDNATLISRVNSLRPNEYPIIIEDPSLIGMEPNEDGTPYFGASISNTSNLYVDSAFGGNTEERYVNTQTNFGLNFDFDNFVKGLFADAFVTFDNYNFVQQKLSKTYATYAIDQYVAENGADAYRAQMVKKVNQNSDINVSKESTTRRIGFNLDGGWKGNAGRSEMSAVAAFRYYKDEVLGASQNNVVTNSTLRLNYSYDSRYFVEAVLGLAGSNQFVGQNRFCFTPVVSFGWILSNEDFLKGSSAVNFLKMKASAGKLAINNDSAYLLYKTAWTDGGTISTGVTNTNSEHYTTLSRIGNPGIGWVTSTEANFGVEGAFLNNRLQAEAGLFYELRENQIGQYGTMYSALVGDYMHNFNYGKISNKGLELAASWSDTAAGGDFRYSAGLNLTCTRNRNLAGNELENIESYRKTIGRPSSAIIDLEAEGLFGKDVELDGHAKQYFGYYGIGDVAYKDQNKDGVVDDKDQTYLGQTFPLTSWGINIDLNYKGFGLYVLGTAETGASKMLNNAYYWNTGSSAYSVKALDRYHPVNNPNGTLPRLTTTSGSNSYRASSFWLEDASFFRLKNFELSYTFRNLKPSSILKSCKVFARGTNVFVLSKIKDLDPEMLAGGVENYPVYSTYTAGVTVSF